MRKRAMSRRCILLPVLLGLTVVAPMKNREKSLRGPGLAALAILEPDEDLLNGPQLILADEPTGNLDEDNAGAVFNALSSFAADGGAVLLVTHDGRSSGRAGKTLLMKDGSIE